MSFYPSYEDQYSTLSLEHKEALKHIPYLEDIEGWLLLEEAAELFILVRNISSPRPVICEIGVWKGKSSYVLATAVRNKGGILYSIDSFDGNGDLASRDSYQKEVSEMPISLLENFQKTLKQFDLSKIVQILPYPSSEARKKFDETVIDMLFIDGNHDYAFVREDYALWSDKLVSGGVLVLHDVGAKHVDGPKRVMGEFISGSPKWRDVRVVGEMGIAVKN